MQKIRIDFDNPGLPQHISAVENDSQSRFFQATLYENGKAYTAPEGAAYSIMYRGFGPQNEGWYDTINDGAGKRAACTASGNVVTCEIARQALQVPGHVSIVLCVTTGKGYMLKSWPIECDCKNDHYDSTAEIQSFFYITQVSNADWTQAIQAVEELKNIIDPTLSLSGKAADAAKVGEAVGELNKDLENYALYNIGYKISKTGVWLDNTGNETEASGWSVTDFVDVSTGNTYSIDGISMPTVKRKYALYDKNKIFTRFIENNTNENSINVEPTYNECYIRLSVRYDDTLKLSTSRNPSKNDYRLNANLNVKYFGAVGDGATDDTRVIQYALNLAKTTGAVVYLPCGKYLITNIEIPENVTLLGENGKNAPEISGSVLYCTDKNNPAVILNSRSTIKNIAFFYPNQKIVNNYPVTYPETIKLTDTATSTLVEIDNINLINSYYAINATPKHEKLRVNNVWGYAINKGLLIDGSTDVDIVNNVHFNYNTLRGFYEEIVNEEFESFTSRVGVAFQFGRCDTAIIQNIFAYGYRIGMQLITSVTAVNKLPPTYTIFTNASMDTCNYPLWIGNASHVLFDNFVGVSNNHTGDYSDVKSCVFIGGGDGVCMSNSILTGFGNMIKSSGNDISLSNCDIRNYNREGETESTFSIETSNGDIAINNSLIIGSTNRTVGFIHGSSNANSITATGCIIKNITMQGKLIQVDNQDTIITQGLNTLINSAGVIN